MGGGVSGALLHANMGAGGGTQTASAEGGECSFRCIWSRWCMLGNEDEPNGPDAWAAQSRSAGTRRAYAQKLAKIADFQEASRETSMAGILAEFLAARAAAGESCVDTMRRCEPLRISDGLGLSSINCTSALRRLRLRWARPYLPPEGLCVLVEIADLQRGALPMACVAVLCWVLWLRVGEVSGLRTGDVSLPLWMRF